MQSDLKYQKYQPICASNRTPAKKKFPANQAPDSWPETKRWRLVDIPVTQTNYDPARDCKGATAAMVTQDLAAISSKPIVDWALESPQAAIDHAYKLPANKALNNNYYQSNRPVVDGQLLKAGVWLANILNEVFR